jgi:ferrochelatase
MSNDPRRLGVLLSNLGTPDAPRTREVRTYLREFLGDPYVLSMAAPLRWMLLNLVILPRRPRKSAEAYAKIWTEEGSPLLVNSLALTRGVQAELGEEIPVELGMRYGTPSLGEALDRLAERGAERLAVLPLYPQYATSSTATSINRVTELLGERWTREDVRFLEWFHEDPGFLEASVEVARPVLERSRPDHVLFSFHGLPENQLRPLDASGSHCLRREDCCATLEQVNRRCYRAQSYATARDLVRGLALPEGSWSVAFQSRLGRTPWIRPYTDEVLVELAGKGVKRLVVLEPSFTADCLETLEEIGMRGASLWRESGGSELLLVPCVNSEPGWVDAVADRIRSSA